ncbi:hypothetical protein HHI36_014282 [Cryptolaemus montrouzieri]|uniref:Trehalase n=1 Tax=Cryptolaemus montrouzieri TaxID=559131 RepID=A0ABD2N216_9CUCU
MRIRDYIWAILVFVETFRNVHSQQPSCDSKIYCRGKLLATVQLARIFPDSKTFVDMEMKYAPEEVLKNFQDLLDATKRKPKRKDIKKFVKENFQPGNELEEWIAPDFNPNPPFLQMITVPKYRQFINDLVKLWSNFSRIMKPDVFEEPERYSIIPVPNGFVVPGGRFSEFYYWDSYWIIKGLLLSGMHETVRGMLENFLSMVDKYGFVPNGGRVYYLNRSQPPFLTLMVEQYIEATNNTEWLKEHFHLLEKELNYWLMTQSVTFIYDDEIHTLAHYAVDSPSPRPESFVEDVLTCAPRNKKKNIENCYRDLKSGAETGWDFSSRWLFDEDGSYAGNLTNIQTRRVIPVDLNSILTQAYRTFASFALALGENDKASKWFYTYEIWKISIEKVLFNPTEGIWNDLDLLLLKHRTGFYPSNLTPLWSEIFHESGYGDLAVNYLKKKGILDFPGGIPTSLLHTGEQWDAPNAWPPLQSIVILGLKRSKDTSAIEVAKQLAEKWIDNNLLIFNRTGFMYEKYSAESVGVIGGGGEYKIQTGFGWSNGVIFELVSEFFSMM